MRGMNFIYVDKTQFVYKLATGSTQYFLTRPRRFGKSLLLSTLKSYFQGQRELFTGLALEKLEEQLAIDENREAWIKYPVLHLDLNAEAYIDREANENILVRHVSEWEKEFDIQEKNDTVAGRFSNIIKQAYEKTGRGVVILVDEYDKPLISTLDKPELHEHYRAILKAFYGNFKSCDSYIRFVLLTGVTKFSQISIFSDLNQLNDISMSDKFAECCGMTQAEIEHIYSEEIDALAVKENITIDECIAEMKKMYDGYYFSKGAKEGMYNPFSVINALEHKSLESYWFATGTPTFLVKWLSERDYNIPSLENEVEVEAEDFSEYRADTHDPIPFLYQAGYLTIKGYNYDDKSYTLGFPNDEVKYGFLKFLAPEYTHVPSYEQTSFIVSFRNDVRNGNVDSFMERLQSLIAGLTYGCDTKHNERDFQVAVYLVFTLIGERIACEVHSAKGRADAIVETKNFVFVFEFKIVTNKDDADTALDAALQQINERGYAERFGKDSRTVYKIAAVFSNSDNQLCKWKVAE